VRDATGRVDTRLHGDVDAAVGAVDDDHVVPCADDEHVGEPATEHGTGVTGQRVVVGELQRAAERDRADPRAVDERRQEARTLRAVTGARDERGREDGREEGSRSGRPPELLEHDRQLGEAVSRPAVLLRDVQAEPAELGELAPERRQRLVRGIEERACGRARLVVLQERAGHRAQLTVRVRDRDRHDQLLVVLWRTVSIGIGRRPTSPPLLVRRTTFRLGLTCCVPHPIANEEQRGPRERTHVDAPAG
jgi:hypothetical protein